MRRALRRHQQQAHLLRRIKAYAYGRYTPEEYKQINPGWYFFKTMGKPCSCYICRAEKYDRNRQKKQNEQIILEQQQ